MKQTVEIDNNLNLVRGLLALMIVWHHLGYEPLYILGNDIAFLFSFPGRVIVWAFYLISGLCIFSGYKKKRYDLSSLPGYLSFARKRLVRILPLFYVTSISVCGLFYFFKSEEMPSFAETIRSFFFLGVNFTFGIFKITPTWFIALLLIMYLTTPLLIKIYSFVSYNSDSPFKLLFRLILLGLLFHVIGFALSGSLDIRNIFGSVILYIFGFMAAEEENRLDIKINCFLIGVLLLLVNFLYHKLPLFFWGLPWELVMGPLFIILLEKIGPFDKQQATRGKTQLFINVLLHKAGRQAFGIYLWHGIVMFIFSNIISLNTGVFDVIPGFIAKCAAFVFISAVSYFLSVLTFMLIEKPAVNLCLTSEKG